MIPPFSLPSLPKLDFWRRTQNKTKTLCVGTRQLTLSFLPSPRMYYADDDDDWWIYAWAWWRRKRWCMGKGRKCVWRGVRSGKERFPSSGNPWWNYFSRWGGFKIFKPKPFMPPKKGWWECAKGFSSERGRGGHPFPPSPTEQTALPPHFPPFSPSNLPKIVPSQPHPSFIYSLLIHVGIQTFCVFLTSFLHLPYYFPDGT